MNNHFSEEKIYKHWSVSNYTEPSIVVLHPNNRFNSVRFHCTLLMYVLSYHLCMAIINVCSCTKIVHSTFFTYTVLVETLNHAQSIN